MFPFTRAKLPEYQPPPELQRLKARLGSQASTNQVSANAMRRANNELGRRERDTKRKLQRSYGGNPERLAELLEEVETGYAGNAADAAVDAEALQLESRSAADARLADIASNEAAIEYEQEMAQFQADMAQDEQLFGLLTGALGSAAGLGASAWQNRRLLEIFRSQSDQPRS
jgi:hypothetical protein